MFFGPNRSGAGAKKFIKCPKLESEILAPQPCNIHNALWRPLADRNTKNELFIQNWWWKKKH